MPGHWGDIFKSIDRIRREIAESSNIEHPKYQSSQSLIELVYIGLMIPSIDHYQRQPPLAQLRQPILWLQNCLLWPQTQSTASRTNQYHGLGSNCSPVTKTSYRNPRQLWLLSKTPRHWVLIRQTRERGVQSICLQRSGLDIYFQDLEG